MSYRFLRVASSFAPYLEQFYARRPGLAAQPYAEQLAAHLHNAFERSDFYSVELRTLGHEAQEVIADAEPLQKQWAREHGVSYAPERWMPEIALAQIAAYQPDVLFLSAWLPAFNADFVRAARDRCPALRLVIGWVGEALRPVDFFRAHDLVLSCAPEVVAHFAAEGAPARLLSHAFAPQILARIAALPPASTPAPAVGFVGNLDYGERYHNRRALMFAAIAQQMDFAFYGTMSQIVYRRQGPVRWARAGYYALLGGLERLGLARVVRRLPRYSAWQDSRAKAPFVAAFASLEARRQAPVYGLEMYQAVARFQVGLNAHGPAQFASNMRLFETTGVGTCLLTDWKPNLGELFALDSEIVAYRSPQEAVERARYLLDHPTERQAIAAAGQRRTLAEHTYAHRTAQLDAIITECLRRAPRK